MNHASVNTICNYLLITISVGSLNSSAVLKVVNSLSYHLDKIQDLPVNIKDRILHLLMKRGGITDDNISKVKKNYFYQ